MEEFFTFAEQQQQRLFMEKYVVFNSTDTVIFKRVLLSTNVKILFFINRYNFDVVNDLPLTGRYEWIRVDYWAGESHQCSLICCEGEIWKGGMKLVDMLWSLSPNQKLLYKES